MAMMRWLTPLIIPTRFLEDNSSQIVLSCVTMVVYLHTNCTQVSVEGVFDAVAIRVVLDARKWQGESAESYKQRSEDLCYQVNFSIYIYCRCLLLLPNLVGPVGPVLSELAV